MKNKMIENIGKGIFALLFGLGNICFFGYLISKNVDFAAMGYMLLFVGTGISLVALFGLLIYSTVQPEKWNSIKIACVYILLNIPAAMLYTFVGLQILGL